MCTLTTALQRWCDICTWLFSCCLLVHVRMLRFRPREGKKLLKTAALRYAQNIKRSTCVALSETVASVLIEKFKEIFELWVNLEKYSHLIHIHESSVVRMSRNHSFSLWVKIKIVPKKCRFRFISKNSRFDMEKPEITHRSFWAYIQRLYSHCANDFSLPSLCTHSLFFFKFVYFPLSLAVYLYYRLWCVVYTTRTNEIWKWMNMLLRKTVCPYGNSLDTRWSVSCTQIYRYILYLT